MTQSDTCLRFKILKCLSVWHLKYFQCTNLKYGPVMLLNKITQMPPVLIRPPFCCVFYRPESILAYLGIVGDLTVQKWQNLVKMSIFIRFFEIWLKTMVLVLIVQFTERSVKYKCFNFISPELMMFLTWNFHQW